MGRLKIHHPDFNCVICDKKFKTDWYQRKSGFGFCGRSCRTVYINQNRPSTAKPIDSRFWAKVNKIEDENSCWEWIKVNRHDGYGSIFFRGRNRVAHRVSWIINIGEIPENMYVCHKCDNPACVRPSHLFLGTHQDNMDDMVKKGRSHLGEAQGISKLTKEIVLKIRSEYIPRKVTMDYLAEKYNVTQGCIWSILRGKSWKHI